jgi:ketosteroid isomerase-like protein
MADPSRQHGTDPESMLRAYFDTKHRGDLEGVLALFSDDVTATMGPFPDGSHRSFAGKSELRTAVEQDIGANVDDALTDVRTEGDTVHFRTRFKAGMLQQLGIDYGESTNQMVVRDGRIVSWTETFTPDFVEKLRRAQSQPTDRG